MSRRRGHALEDGGPVALDRGQHRGGGEPGDQRHGAAEPHADVHDAGQPEYVEQRQDGDHDVQLSRLDIEQAPGDVGAFMYSWMWVKPRPPWAGRGPRGVDDDGGVRGLPGGHLARWRRAVEQPFQGNGLARNRPPRRRRRSRRFRRLRRPWPPRPAPRPR